MYTIGADPELFFKRGDNFVSAIGKIGGSKYAPRRLLGGFALQEDNVAVEYNIPACSNTDRFVWANKLMLDEIKEIAEAHECNLAIVSSGRFSDAELDNDFAKVFGCDPDFNAWDLEINPAPNSEDKNLRSAGGHIHVGMPADTPNKDKLGLVMVMDAIIGVPLAFMDPESKRRELYGQAGACRLKPYGVEYRTPSNVWLRDEKLMQMVSNIIFSLEDTWKNLLPEVRKQESVIRKAINTLDEDSYLSLNNLFFQFWPSSILRQFVQLKTPKPSHISLTIEE